MGRSSIIIATMWLMLLLRGCLTEAGTTPGSGHVHQDDNAVSQAMFQPANPANMTAVGAYASHSLAEGQSAPDKDVTAAGPAAALPAAAAATAAEAGAKLSPGIVAAAVVVPILIVALAIFWWKRRQQKQPQQQRGEAIDYGDDLESQRKIAQQRLNIWSYAANDRVRGDSAYMKHQPFNSNPDWRLASSGTAPRLCTVQDPNTCAMGKLIGSGSSAQVHRVQWAGLEGEEVALKVIEHDTDMLPALQQQLETLMTWNHPHIVRAYHYATYVQQQQQQQQQQEEDHVVFSQAPVFGAAGSGSGSRLPSALSSTPEDSVVDATVYTIPIGLDQYQGLEPSSASDAAAAAAADDAAADVLSRDALKEAIEADIWQQRHLQHQKASAAAAAGRTAAAASKAQTYLVTEYCDMGTLADVTSEWAPTLQGAPDDHMLQRLALLMDVGRGLEALHLEEIVHGDLSARNVLVNSCSDAPFGLVAKLADAGLSRVLKLKRRDHGVNALSHQAPELLRGAQLTPAADIYSYGILMWETFTGQAAFRKLKPAHFFDAVVLQNLRPLIPQGMPADYQLLMSACWAGHAEDRPNVGRVLDCLRCMIQERVLRCSLKPPSGVADAAEIDGKDIPPALLPLLAPRQPAVTATGKARRMSFQGDQMYSACSASSRRGGSGAAGWQQQQQWQQGFSADRDQLNARLSFGASSTASRSEPLSGYVIHDELAHRLRGGLAVPRVAPVAAAAGSSNRSGLLSAAATEDCWSESPDVGRRVKSALVQHTDPSFLTPVAIESDSWLLQRSTASFTAGSARMPGFPMYAGARAVNLPAAAATDAAAAAACRALGLAGPDSQAEASDDGWAAGSVDGGRNSLEKAEMSDAADAYYWVT